MKPEQIQSTDQDAQIFLLKQFPNMQGPYQAPETSDLDSWQS